MDLSAPGVFVFLDNLSGPELGPFARQVGGVGIRGEVVVERYVLLKDHDDMLDWRCQAPLAVVVGEGDNGGEVQEVGGGGKGGDRSRDPDLTQAHENSSSSGGAARGGGSRTAPPRGDRGTAGRLRGDDRAVIHGRRRHAVRAAYIGPTLYEQGGRRLGHYVGLHTRRAASWPSHQRRPRFAVPVERPHSMRGVRRLARRHESRTRHR